VLLMQYSYIRDLWIKGVTAVLLVHGRREMWFMPTVTAVLLHNCAVDRGIEYSVVITG